MEKVNDDLLINYVKNNLGQIVKKNGFSGELCGYNLDHKSMIFGTNDRRYGWGITHLNDIILTVYPSYFYLLNDIEIEHLILYGEIN